MLKMHQPRRHEFVDQVLQAAGNAAYRSQMIADCLFHSAIGWGRLTFFIAIGLLLFAWPRFSHDDAQTIDGYVLLILYLMSPLEQIMGWLPTHELGERVGPPDRTPGLDARRSENQSRWS